MKDPDVASIVTLVVVIAIGILAAAAVLAWIYVENVYRDRDADARELTRLVRRDRRIALGGLLIEIVVIWSCLTFVWPETFHAIPRPWGAVLIGLVMALLLLGPIDDALAFRALRREAREDADLRAETDVLPPLEDDLP